MAEEATPNDPPVDPPSSPPETPPVELKPNGSVALEPDGEALPVEPEWREDWRERFAGKNTDDLKKLNRYKSPDGIWRAYRALEQRMSSGEYTRNKPQDADEEKLAEWRKEVGVPETPEGYRDALPKDFEIAENDKPFIDNLFKEMHAIDATPAVVAKGVETYYRIQASAEEIFGERDAQQKRDTEDALRGEWGPEYRTNFTHMNNTLFDSGVFVDAPEGMRDKLFSARLPDGTSLANDPDLLRWMVDMSRVINPDVGHSVTPVPGKTQGESVASRIAELESMSADTRGPYWKGNDADALQAELRQLYSIEEKMQARK